MRYYINTKARLVAKGGLSRPEVRSPLLFPVDKSALGRDLFRQDHATSINAEATKRREDLGQDSKQHAGHYQRVLRERWEALPESERAAWVTKAEKLNTQGSESWDDPQIYR